MAGVRVLEALRDEVTSAASVHVAAKGSETRERFGSSGSARPAQSIQPKSLAGEQTEQLAGGASGRAGSGGVHRPAGSCSGDRQTAAPAATPWVLPVLNRGEKELNLV